jgi:mRNA-degrading endonuclease RelE of RelBE toxin-antitoxin system
VAEERPYQLTVAGPAARALATQLPEGVAAAVIEFITGDLLRTPRRVGKPLHNELAGQWSARRGTYRVLYTIDDEHQAITVLVIDHRSDVYRPR